MSCTHCNASSNAHKSCARHSSCWFQGVYRPSLCKICQSTYRDSTQEKDLELQARARKSFEAWITLIINNRRNNKVDIQDNIWFSQDEKDSFLPFWNPKFFDLGIGLPLEKKGKRKASSSTGSSQISKKIALPAPSSESSSSPEEIPLCPPSTSLGAGSSESNISNHPSNITESSFEQMFKKRFDELSSHLLAQVQSHLAPIISKAAPSQNNELAPSNTVSDLITDWNSEQNYSHENQENFPPQSSEQECDFPEVFPDVFPLFQDPDTDDPSSCMIFDFEGDFLSNENPDYCEPHHLNDVQQNCPLQDSFSHSSFNAPTAVPSDNRALAPIENSDSPSTSEIRQPSGSHLSPESFAMSLSDFWWVPPKDFSLSSEPMLFRGGSILPSDLSWTTLNGTKVFKPLNLDNQHVYNLVYFSQIFQAKEPKDIIQSLFEQLKPAICASRLPKDKNWIINEEKKEFCLNLSDSSLKILTSEDERRKLSKTKSPFVLKGPKGSPSQPILDTLLENKLSPGSSKLSGPLENSTFNLDKRSIEVEFHLSAIGIFFFFIFLDSNNVVALHWK